MKVHENGYHRQAELFLRKLNERIPLSSVSDDMEVTLCVDPSIGKSESYLIETEEAGHYRIIGSDEPGLCYGIGKFLHSADWSDGGFVPNPPKGVVTPACSYRVIYFSVHFYNWYQMAPAEELESYLEDLFLWGYNGIHGIAPVATIDSFEDEMFLHAVEVNRRLFRLAKDLGMKTSFGICPNQGLRSAPHELDADLSYDPVGTIRGWTGRNLCPSKPGTLEYLRNVWTKQMEPYTDIGIDYVQVWPYDEGGCGCEKCRPWGANGYCEISIAAREVALKLYPDAKFVVSTWIFDRPEDYGEYEGLYARLKTDMAWADYLMIDAHDMFPRYPLEHEVIKPVVNFPEISMWGLYPWGAYGANPLPKRFQKIWDSSKRILDGGQPYSEGNFEDILKIQCVGYYWEPDKNYRDILTEYINYEYSPKIRDEALEIMELIEQNHVTVGYGNRPDVSVSERAAELARAADAKLEGSRAKDAWRWRILYIRAILDEKRYRAFMKLAESEKADIFDLIHFSGKFLTEDEEAQEMFAYLRSVYHSVPLNGVNMSTLPPLHGELYLGGAYADKNSERAF